MRKTIGAAALVLLAACASQTSNANGKVPEPTVEIEQISSMPTAAQGVSGGIPVQLRMSVTNNAAIPITLQNARLETIGEGGWNLRSTQQNFGKAIVPGGTETVEFWVAAQSGLSVVGNNGPVQLRVTAAFQTTDGGFSTTVVQPVGGLIR